jgi:hypothetical protein
MQKEASLIIRFLPSRFSGFYGFPENSTFRSCLRDCAGGANDESSFTEYHESSMHASNHGKRRPARRAAFPVALALLAFAAEAALGAVTPRTFIADIYIQYTDEEAPVLIWNGEDAERLFAPALARAIVSDARAADLRVDGVPRLDYDPFVLGQDYEIRGLVIDVLDSRAQSAVVRARFRNFRKPVAIRFDLIRHGRSWRIHDMRWDRSSLRRIYGLR